MDSNRSRLPRAASNPAIRPVPAPSTSTSTSTLSRLPGPAHIVRQSTVARKPSIPLRSNKKITPTDTQDQSSNSPAKRLLPSRSTLGLAKPTFSAPVRASTKQPPGHPNPLGPKRTIPSATATYRTSSVASSSSVKPISTSSVCVKNGKDNCFKSPDPFTEIKISTSNGSTTRTNIVKGIIPKKGFLGLGSPSRPTRIPTTPLSRPPQAILQTPALPRITSIPWTSHNPDDQLKDVELSFTAEDDSNDNSLIEPLDFGFATSRFNSKSALPLYNNTCVSDLENIQYERDEKVREVRELKSQGVKEAWSEVVRAGEGDLEEVMIMQELIEALMLDMDMRGNSNAL
ncbi:hypothetical protein I204_00691 [Kwoniella mangroviensis CBS 8886]|uniref:uncharacterized protein n=1 Tax=Kwoniella mangroviensis CBS 8507 TaxID=1296122 RepID=UPI00080D7B58|nr:uncharacterized protein I203_07061 [Kwoniella mangroviensis CBS 8507]OCF63742.1 hypothetical protein I203_07061 [Kwoniella mangroviensis CBS 8507]OCF78747.1 hypothetical protein I204_00691 [Kwoniella mangroviensis CBS 8886]